MSRRQTSLATLVPGCHSKTSPLVCRSKTSLFVPGGRSVARRGMSAANERLVAGEVPTIAVIGLVGHSQFFEVPRFHNGGETITASSLFREWGGKGFNQAVAAARQGADARFLGAVNAVDVPPLQDFCRAEGIGEFLCARPEPTATAAILTDGTGETRVTVFPGAALRAEDVMDFVVDIGRSDFLLLGNEVPEAVNLAAIRVAKRFGTKIVYNPAPARPLAQEILEAVDIFTPNEFEEKSLELQASGSRLNAEVITTLGAKGCRIRSTGEVIPAPAATAVDSTGAGDTFSAVLAVRLAEGESLHDACVAANAAAAQSVAIRHVMPSIPFRATRKKS